MRIALCILGIALFFLLIEIRRFYLDRKYKITSLRVGQKVKVNVKNGSKIVTINLIFRNRKIIVSGGVEYKFKDIIF